MNAPIYFLSDLFRVLGNVGQVLLGERARRVEIVRLDHGVDDVIRDPRLVEELTCPGMHDRMGRRPVRLRVRLLVGLLDDLFQSAQRLAQLLKLCLRRADRDRRGLAFFG